MDLQLFEHPDFGAVRTFIKEGEPFFVGKDVADVLGYKETAKAIREHVDEEDKGVSVLDTPGGQQNLVVINESGLYSLILSSKLPKAKGFKRWVTKDVLPAIRKTGMYATETLLDNPDLLIEALEKLKAERKRNEELKTLAAVQNQQILELQPKATYYDKVLQSDELLPISVIAKDYGLSGRKMNKLLHELGIQFKQGNIWLLYQQYADQGYTMTKTHQYDDSYGSTHTKVSTYWTQQGRLFLYHVMVENGYLPTMEQ